MTNLLTFQFWEFIVVSFPADGITLYVSTRTLLMCIVRSILGSDNVLGTSVCACMTCGRALVADATIMCFWRDTTSSDNIEKDVDQHVHEYFDDSPDGHRAILLEMDWMAFPDRETLSITLEAHCSFCKWKYLGLVRYLTGMELFSSLSIFTSLYFMAWADCAFKTEISDNNQITDWNADIIEIHRECHWSSLRPLKNNLRGQWSLDTEPNRNSTARVTTILNQPRAPRSQILVNFGMIPLIGTAYLRAVGGSGDLAEVA